MQAPEGRARAQFVYVSKSIGRRLRWAPQDLRERSGRGALVPPRGLSFVGGGDFVRVGREHLELFTEHGGLKPGDRVLDVGCGIGRMAVPLLDYLDAEGSYAGFDVGKAMIEWCRKNITARRADFEFTWAPIYNRKYNPFGTIAAEEFRFPYADDSFDFIFATSLFTHLTLADARHYLAEVGRVLAPGRPLLPHLLRPRRPRPGGARRGPRRLRLPLPGRAWPHHRPPRARGRDRLRGARPPRPLHRRRPQDRRPDPLRPLGPRPRRLLRPRRRPGRPGLSAPRRSILRGHGFRRRAFALSLHLARQQRQAEAGAT